MQKYVKELHGSPYIDNFAPRVQKHSKGCFESKILISYTCMFSDTFDSNIDFRLPLHALILYNKLDVP